MKPKGRIATGVSATVVLALGVSALAGVASNAAAASNGQTLVVVDGGGTYHDGLEKAIYKPFEKATGIKIVSEAYDYSLGAIKAQVQGAKQWDVVNTSIPLTNRQAAQLYAPINYKIVNAKDDPKTDVGKYFLWTVYNGNVLTYVPGKYRTAPTSWADVWNTKKYPGTRAFWNSPQSVLEIALLAQGVRWNKMYPLNVKRAFKSLNTLTSEAKVVWYDTGAQQVQDFSNGTATIGEGWDGRIINARQQGVKVTYTDHGAVSGGTAWSVLKTAPDKKAAMEFVNFANSAQAGAAMAKAFPGTAPANRKSYHLMSRKLSASLASSPQNAKIAAGNMSNSWWASNYNKVYGEWQTWYTTHQG